jgi:hypothetical protein
MTAKKTITILLLAFVALTTATIVAKETGFLNRAAPSPSDASAPQSAPVKVVASYFHGNFRCAKCRTIEAYTAEAIQSGFAEELQKGTVELKIINVETAGNEHYANDYQLDTRSVVLARYENDAQKEWKRLDALWGLIGDKDAFIKTVQEETRLLLGAK